jgi:DMSO/TMAO reductase YedYZ heme-binding membrane subunit
MPLREHWRDPLRLLVVLLAVLLAVLAFASICFNAPTRVTYTTGVLFLVLALWRERKAAHRRRAERREWQRHISRL